MKTLVNYTVADLREDFELNLELSETDDLPTPLMLLGQHGIGKSQILEQLAEEHKLEVVNIRASQYTEGDFVGVPKQIGDSNFVKFLKLEMFKKAIDGSCLLFFDELDRAPMEVRQAIFQIAGSRAFAGEKLHPRTLIVAAINGNLSDDYQTYELDMAEASRWAIVEFKPTINEWLNWGSETKELSPVVIAFLKERVELIESDFSGDKKVALYDRTGNLNLLPDRRKWHRFSKALVKKVEKNHTSDSITKKCASYFGTPVAIAFDTFRKSYKKIKITPENFFKLKDKDVESFVLELVELDIDVLNDFINMVIKRKEIKKPKNNYRLALICKHAKREITTNLLLNFDVKHAIKKGFIEKETVYSILGFDDKNIKELKEVEENFILTYLTKKEFSEETDSDIEEFMKPITDIYESGIVREYPLSLIEIITQKLMNLTVFNSILPSTIKNNTEGFIDGVTVLQKYWNLDEEEYNKVVESFINPEDKE